MAEHLKEHFVILNYSHFLLPPVLCRCTSCRDVVTMAAKLTERKDGGRESKKTNPVPNASPEEGHRQRKRERREGQSGG